MNVLVTGGTGFVGREIVRQLHNTGHRTILLARRPEARATREVATLLGARVRPGDVLDGDSLRNTCAGVEAVIHLVGIISECGNQTFENVHARGTRNMIFAAQDAGIKRFLHMSALGTRPGSVSRYHQTKWAAEEQVRQSGLGWTVFRPSIIYGPGDGFVNLFARIIRFSPILPVLGSGQNQFQPVAVQTVASAFVKALTESRAVGEVYDLGGPEMFTFDELLDQILDAMERRRLKLHLPMSLARTQAALLEWLYPRWLHRAPPLNRDQLIMLQEDNVGNAQPANELFGLKPIRFREAIAAYAK